MDFSRRMKVAIGLAPLAVLVVSFGGIGLWMSGPFPDFDDPESMFSTMLARMLPLQFTLLLVSAAVIGLYIYLVMSRVEDEGSQRLVWMLVVLLGGYIGQLVFFFMRVWPEPEQIELRRQQRALLLQVTHPVTGWFYLGAQDERVGPVTESALRSLIRTGDIEPDSLVWTDGMAGWEAADVVLPEYSQQPPITGPTSGLS